MSSRVILVEQLHFRITKIDELIFNVNDARTFLQSNITNQVKAVRFQVALPGSRELLENFFTKISNSLEKVIFDFAPDDYHLHYYNGGDREYRQSEMFHLVLEKCQLLETIEIPSTNCNFLVSDKFSSSPVKNMQINIKTLVEYPDLMESFQLFLERQSELVKLSLCWPPQPRLDDQFDDDGNLLIDDVQPNDDDIPEEFIRIIESRIQRQGSKLIEVNMKDIILEQENLYKFILRAGQPQYNCMVRSGSPLMDLNKFLRIAKRENIEITPRHLVSFWHCNVEFDNITTPQPVTQLGQFRHIAFLHMTFNRNCWPQEVAFIPKYRHLLSLTCNALVDGFNGISHECVSPGNPKLGHFGVVGDIFVDPERTFSSLHILYPNLRVLNLDKCQQLPGNLIASLVKIDSLRTLQLSNSNITDNAFVQPVPLEGDTAAVPVPAIAAFKKLESLDILFCNQLTDRCIFAGVAWSKTLRYLTLEFNIEGQFTIDGLAAVEQGGIMRIAQRLWSMNDNGEITWKFLCRSTNVEDIDMDS